MSHLTWNLGSTSLIVNRMISLSTSIRGPIISQWLKNNYPACCPSGYLSYLAMVRNMQRPQTVQNRHEDKWLSWRTRLRQPCYRYSRRKKKSQAQYSLLNPLFSESVKNNIGKEFLIKLIDKYFPLTTTYGKYATAFPWKSTTVACPIWLQLNRASTKTFSAKNRSQTPPANCPFSGECREKDFIYKTSITSGGTSNVILSALKRNLRPVITITPTPSDIERKEMRRISQKHFGMQKTVKKEGYFKPAIKWSISDRANAYQPGSGFCNLCLTIRNSQFFQLTSIRRSTKDQSLRGNAGIKTNTSWKTFDNSFNVFNRLLSFLVTNSTTFRLE